MILTGPGPKAFVAGADIGELSKQNQISGKALGDARPGGIPAAGALWQTGGRRDERLRPWRRVRDRHGLPPSGGRETAAFGQPEVKLGIVPGYAGTERLPRLVGKGRALDLLLTARMVGAEEALQIGLVNRVVPAEKLLAEAEQLLAGEIGRVVDRDLARGQSHVGPHRDDVVLSLGGHALRDYGSTGQQWLAAIALRFLEQETLAARRGVRPVLLVDDVFAELDGGRPGLPGGAADVRRPGQRIVTAPRIEELPGQLELPRWLVRDGRVEVAA